MGLGPSKDDKSQNSNIAIAQVQSLSGQVESKLNYVGIGLLVIGVVLLIIFLYVLRAKCKRHVNSWLRKTVESLPPPTAIRVSNVPPQQMQAAPSVY